MLSYTKDQSLLLKGIAILMMLFTHLFSGRYIGLSTSLVYIAGKPLASWLVGACGPVAFFMIISGYGLACKYEQGSLSVIKQLSRVLKLYIHYWIALILFVTIAHYLHPESYPGSITRIIHNLTGWKISYNGEMWFLLPYALLSVFSIYIIRCIDYLGNTWALIITVLINLCTCYLLSRHGDIIFTHMSIHLPIMCFHLLQSFSMGVILRRTSLQLNFNLPQWAVLAFLATLVLIVCVTHSSLRYIIYAPLMVITLCNVHWPRLLRAILMELGRKSMPMWMIHTWLAYYLFQPQVYSLRYPLFIFLGLVTASYLISIPVMWVAGIINNKLLVPSKKRG
jgi:hypothetical protein